MDILADRKPGDLDRLRDLATLMRAGSTPELIAKGFPKLNRSACGLGPVALPNAIAIFERNMEVAQ